MNLKMSKRLVSNFQTLNKKSLDVSLHLDGTCYSALQTLGCGTYGVVSSAINSHTNGRVAIKKIPGIFDNLILAKRTYREIRILRHIKHENVIGLRDLFIPEGFSLFKDIYIVFDFMETDLHQIITSKQPLSDQHVRYFLYQLLRGLKYIHSANILHRDLKPSNLLVNENCDLKIGDFGMARPTATSIQDNGVLMSHYVATRWYRSPELMLFRIQYTTAVDVWSVGCIFAEMLGRKPIFPGRDLGHQIMLIINVLGSPADSFIEMAHTERVKDFLRGLEKKSAISLDEKYPTCGPKALRLLAKMLRIDPRERISVDDALRDLYLNQYHDPEDEPTCSQPFSFDFNEQELNEEQIRDLIHKEVSLYSNGIMACATDSTKESPDLNNVLYHKKSSVTSHSDVASQSISLQLAEMNELRKDWATLNKHLSDSRSSTDVDESEIRRDNKMSERAVSCDNLVATDQQTACELLREMKPLKTMDYSVDGVTIARMQSWKISGSNDSKNSQRKNKCNRKITKRNDTRRSVSGTDECGGVVNVKAALRATLLSEGRDFRTKAAKMKEKKLKKLEQCNNEAHISTSSLSTEDNLMLERWQKMQTCDTKSLRVSSSLSNSNDNCLDAVRASGLLLKCVPILPKLNSQHTDCFSDTNCNVERNVFHKNIIAIDSNNRTLFKNDLPLQNLTIKANNSRGKELQENDYEGSILEEPYVNFRNSCFSESKENSANNNGKGPNVIEGVDRLNVEMKSASNSASNSASLSDCGLDSSKINHLINSLIDPLEPMIFVSSADAALLNDTAETSILSVDQPLNSTSDINHRAPTFKHENNIGNHSIAELSQCVNQQSDLIGLSSERTLSVCEPSSTRVPDALSTCKPLSTRVSDSLSACESLEDVTVSTMSAGSGYGIGIELDYAMEEIVCTDHSSSGLLSSSISQWLLSAENTAEDLDSLFMRQDEET